jgi:hypothetical protein
MHVPCPVPLQSPWSPVGYQVVEVSDAGPPVVGLAPESGSPNGNAPLVRPAIPPSSPVGYKVVVTEKATPRSPATPLIKPMAVRSWSRKISNPVILWASIGIGVTFVMGLTLVLAIVRASDETPAQGPMQAIFAAKRGPVVNIPEAGLVKMPREGAAEKPVAPAKNDGQPQLAAEPAFPGLPAAPACDNAACNVDRPGMGRPDRETFGTSVEFVRNPLEAARVAGQERKLTFILHVSGNFEEARFT